MPGTKVAFAEGSGPDKRSYQVDCSKLARVFPVAVPSGLYAEASRSSATPTRAMA